MTLMVHLGIEFENQLREVGTLPDPSTVHSIDEKELYRVIRESLEADPAAFTKLSKKIIGVSEETTTGVFRLN